MDRHTFTVDGKDAAYSNARGAYNMIWTRRKPTKAGWWWHRLTRGQEVVEVIDCGNRFSCRHTGDGLLYTIPKDNDRGDHGEWSSEPIQEPKEA